MSPDAQLVVSNGLFTHYKRLDRIVPAMASVLAEHPETFLLLLGREHPSETFAGRLMKNLVDRASLTSPLCRCSWMCNAHGATALACGMLAMPAVLAPHLRISDLLLSQE